ncbi:hypothetical protein D9M09_14765 [Janthinobacterium agaricidamnosum]|uniref:Uncharacterized protein n=1 Tax=Janthinobacterium agaricidamnosum TaxID=55508 RepID=A0A3G2EAQ9_9BURK|nr:hypothetical protein [Janthinobacterium agaricidamnosum]AYM76920.1 hypothetical protein D9M09_14765 [Janthinobacterium agaricidamnosum]
MQNQENKIAANKRLAELLGWSNIAEVNGALIGTPPAGAAESRGQALVPDWASDWAAAGPLAVEYNIVIEPGTRTSTAGGYMVHHYLHTSKNAAVTLAIAMAVMHKLASAR